MLTIENFYLLCNAAEETDDRLSDSKTGEPGQVVDRTARKRPGSKKAVTNPFSLVSTCTLVLE